MKRLVILVAVGALFSCGQVLAQSKLKPPLESGWRPDEVNADYGPYPAEYETIIKTWYLENLKDPESAIFGRISKPRKEHKIVNQFKKQALFGYSVCAAVNGRNSYGGYTGNRTRWFLIRDDMVVSHQEAKYPIYINRPVNCADGP